VHLYLIFHCINQTISELFYSLPSQYSSMSQLEEEYRLDYFTENGFHRKQCPECGDHFWTRDAERELCGEPPCEPYSFIDNPGFDEKLELEEMREAFLSFFEEHGHERIEPYPVAANRWRDDVLLTQASIYDFQPLVTSGETPPPANPLTISQPCIRMQDIDNVGKTGRHTMAFEMMAHHAFNTRASNLNPAKGIEDKKMEKIFCTAGRLNRNVVLPDGRVILCCMDYSLKHIIGDLTKENYRAIFSKKPYLDVLDKMKKGDNDLLCQTCEKAKPISAIPLKRKLKHGFDDILGSSHFGPCRWSDSLVEDSLFEKFIWTLPPSSPPRNN